jgi:Ribosomal protein HS6-type (S12/L30/L7a)
MFWDLSQGADLLSVGAQQTAFLFSAVNAGALLEAFMLSELSNAKAVAGCKQTLRAIRQGSAAKVFLANDVDPSLTGPVAKAAKEAGLAVEQASMRELGRACGIDLPTAAAAVIMRGPDARNG